MKVKKDFNYKIAELFLRNTRLTVLTLALFTIIAIVASMIMFGRTTGFPNSPINAALIQTFYPEGSANTVLEEITKPLEGAVKDVDGVDSYTSFSSNSFSTIQVTIDESENSDIVKSRLDAAIKAVELPEGAESPKVISINIGGGEFSYAFYNEDNNLEEIYNAYKTFESELTQIPETSGIKSLVELEKKVQVKLSLQTLAQNRLNVSDIESLIRTLNANLPIGIVVLDNKRESIITSLGTTDLDTLKNLTIISNTTQKPLKLSELAEIGIIYEFENNEPSFLTVKVDGQTKTFQALNVTVSTSKGTNLSKYDDKLEEALNNINAIEYINDKGESKLNSEKVTLLETFDPSTGNEDQVNEVLSGLIGGELNVENNALAKLGWTLGGLQLVFLVMLALVSWRAAIVAALSIPLSLAFSTIYLFAIGEDLNTLVLFSLVLVIGLVVDPALVILESLQRKIDSGLKGVEAGLEAVRDVGSGLFMAMLTNVIVFAPFGLISGVLGDIFSYLPLTIVPAIIGSYLVPLIVLTWVGSKFLKRTRNKKDGEEANLWRVSRLFIRINERILNWHPAIRIAIVIFALLIPMGVTGYLFGKKEITQVEFSQSDEAEYASLSLNYFNDVSVDDARKSIEEILNLIGSKEEIREISYIDFGGQSAFLIRFVDPKERKDKTAKEIVDEIREEVSKSQVTDKFYDYYIDLLSVGPGGAPYQVALSVKSDDLAKLQTASLDVNRVANLICYSGNTVTIDENCDDGERIVTKVNDGYTGLENTVYELVINREKIIANNLALPSEPITGLVYAQISQQFALQSPLTDLGSINLNDEEIEIVLEKTSPDPTNLDQLLETPLFGTTGPTNLKLKDVVEVKEIPSKASIQRFKGQTIGEIQIRLAEGKDDQTIAALVQKAIIDYYKNDDFAKTKELGLEEEAIGKYEQGDAANFQKSFVELMIALVLAIFFSYFVLAIFYRSLTQPFVILFTVPLTFLGVFPALSIFTNGQFGFLEIIGLIILIGIVENVAIFLIDGALKKIEEEKWEEKRAISYMSGLRLKPIALSTLTAVASLIPLALFSEIYRPIAIVLIFGLISSGLISLITTPILFIFFRWTSKHFWAMKPWQKILAALPMFTPIFLIVWTVQEYTSRTEPLNFPE